MLNEGHSQLHEVYGFILSLMTKKKVLVMWFLMNSKLLLITGIACVLSHAGTEFPQLADC